MLPPFHPFAFHSHCSNVIFLCVYFSVALKMYEKLHPRRVLFTESHFRLFHSTFIHLHLAFIFHFFFSYSHLHIHALFGMNFPQTQFTFRSFLLAYACFLCINFFYFTTFSHTHKALVRTA